MSVFQKWFNESFELLRKIYVLFVIYLTLQLDNVVKHWEASSTSITKDVGIRVIVYVLLVCHYYSTKILDRFACGIWKGSVFSWKVYSLQKV